MAWKDLREDLNEMFGELPTFERRWGAGNRGWRYGGLTQGRTDEPKVDQNRRHQQEYMARQYAAGLPRGGKGGRANKLKITPEVLALVQNSTSANELAKQLGRSRALAFRLRATFRC